MSRLSVDAAPSAIDLQAGVENEVQAQAQAPAHAPARAMPTVVAGSTSERSPRTFGLKDVFTCINIVSGVIAVIFCIEGNIRYAAYAFLLGYILGDSLDGLVARATNTCNRFGAEFDVVGDHLVQCIVPGFMLYVAYKPISPYLGGALAAVLIVSGSIRHARASVASPDFPIAYLGMPRTVSAFLVVSYLNSAFVHMMPGWVWVGIPLVLFVSVAQLVALPFRNHKGRKLKWWVKYLVFAFFTMTIGWLLLAPNYVFDVTFGWLIAYASTSWIEMDPEERKEFFVKFRRWAEEVRRAR